MQGLVGTLLKQTQAEPGLDALQEEGQRLEDPCVQY